MSNGWEVFQGPQKKGVEMHMFSVYAYVPVFVPERRQMVCFIQSLLSTKEDCYYSWILLSPPKHNRCCLEPSHQAAPLHPHPTPLVLQNFKSKDLLNTQNLFLKVFGSSQMDSDSQPLKRLEGENREYCSFLFILFHTEFTHLPRVRGSFWLDNALFN